MPQPIKSVPQAERTTEEMLVEELKKTHGIREVHRFVAESGETVYLKMPPQPLWRRFRSQITDDKRRTEAPELLLRSCLLHPTQDAFDVMLEERPGLLDTFASQLVELAGLAKEVEKKVL